VLLRTLACTAPAAQALRHKNKKALRHMNKKALRHMNKKALRHMNKKRPIKVSN